MKKAVKNRSSLSSRSDLSDWSDWSDCSTGLLVCRFGGLPVCHLTFSLP